MARYRCTVCNWTYSDESEGKPFSDVSEEFHCPICGAPKTAFTELGHSGNRASEEASTTVADGIVAQLVALGVKTAYGIPGDSNLPLIEAIRSDGQIRFVLTRHEETAAFMACAHGKTTGELGVCISIAGPGATNLITGLIDAAADRSPVLALVGQVPEVYLGSEAFQEIDQLELLHPFAAFAETVARPSQATKLVLMAAKHALARPGVAILSTPTDILAERFASTIFSPDDRLFEAPTSPAPESVTKAAKLIETCQQPVLLAGWGAREHRDELLALADTLQAPIATTSRGKGMIDETDPRALGVLGSIGSKHAAQMIQAADLLIIVGSGFRHANLIPQGVCIIQIDRDPTRIGRTFDIDAGLVGDAGYALRALAQAVEQKPRDIGFWERLGQLRALHQAELDSDKADQSMPIHPGFVIQALNRHVSHDAIICCDVGDHTYWFYKKFQCRGQKTYMSANVASMGFALPAALSAQIDFPDHQIVALTGDGGFGMVATDITTAVREKLPITVIVFNDGKLKNIKKEQARDGYPEFGISFPNPDFAAFARSAGADGYRVERPDQLDEALALALTSDRPALLDVLVDPERMAAATKRAANESLGSIRPLPDGPHLVKNVAALLNSKGKSIETSKSMTLCRCGGSSTKPFCDGTHAKIEFSGERESDGSFDHRDDYVGRNITIHDNRGICSHAGFCTDNLPTVFRMGVEPWIDPDGADSEEVVRVIKMCPSGALSYSVSGVEHRDQKRDPKITVRKNGHYAVTGGIAFEGEMAGEHASAEHYTLCRCGKSKNKPFCDGTHWHVSFTDDKS